MGNNNVFVQLSRKKTDSHYEDQPGVSGDPFMAEVCVCLCVGWGGGSLLQDLLTQDEMAH